MRFCSFLRKSDNRESWGAMSGSDSVADFSAIAPDLKSFLEKDGLSKVGQLFKEIKNHPQFKMDEIVLRACIPNPGSIRDGYAFRQHVEASRKHRGLPMIPEYDEFPVFYFGDHRSIIGSGDVKVQAKHLEQLDFELEVGIVIGKKGKNITAEKADEFIAGYTIWNDWSARSLQAKEMKLNMGPCKGKDFANSLGPWLVTRDELQPKLIPSQQGERYDLSMKAFLNGEKISEGNLKDMTYTFAQIIERASYGTYLYPGDVIGSGTCGTGCFMELNGYTPTAKWLKENDQLDMEVEGMGRLSNRIVKVSDDFQP
ncbi:MAG: fumarylacetoacetate hydrolase family protein [Bdellovibrionota bacterium]